MRKPRTAPLREGFGEITLAGPHEPREDKYREDGNGFVDIPSLRFLHVKFGDNMDKKPIQVRLTKGTLAEIDKSVKTGKFMNRSDFIRDSIRKADKKKIDTLEKGLRNLSEHDNLAPRLLEIEKKTKILNIHTWINYILFLILLLHLLFFGGMLLS